MFPTEEFVQKLLFQVSGQSYVAHEPEPSKDHQGQFSLIATCHSLMVENAPQGARSATHDGVGLTGLYTPRAISWCTRVSAKPEESLVWSLA